MGSTEILEPEELRQEITDEIFKIKNLRFDVICKWWIKPV